MDPIKFSTLLNILGEWMNEIRTRTPKGASNSEITDLDQVNQLQPILSELQLSLKNLVLQNMGFVAFSEIFGREGPRDQNYFDSIPVRCWVINHLGVIEEANQTMIDMIPGSQGLVVGSDLYRHFPNPVALRIREKVEEVIRTQQDAHLIEEIWPYLIHTITPLSQQKDKRKRIAIITYNLSSKLEEKVLRETEERSLQLVELSPDAIVVHTEMKVVYINTAGIELFGATQPEEVLSKPVLDLIHPDDREFVHARIKKIESEGVSSPLREYRIVRFDGKAVDVEAKGTLIIYNGRPSNLVIIRDITVRKAAERELKALNERLNKEQKHRKFLSKRLIDLLERDRHEVAMELHDHIGQLLTNMKMDLEIISSELKQATPQLQYRIRTAYKKTGYAISDLRKIAHGLMPEIIKSLGLIPSLRALINNIDPQLGLNIHFFTKDIHARFDMDKELAIYRIAQEALSNIIKHSHAKQVFINLIRRDHLILFSVEDDGMGFEIEEKMFITSDQGPLGLHIMRERIVQLGGELTIDSRNGAGTHILAELPL